MRRGALGVAVLLMLTGCSDDPDRAAQESTSGVTVEDDGTQVIDLRETDDYRFAPQDPHVKPGQVRIDMTNTSTAVTHSLAFKPGGPVEEIPFINPGDTRSISFTITTPGEYQFFCTFHEQLGQRGILTVDPP